MSAGSAPRTKTDNRKSRNLGSRVPEDIDGGVTKSSIIEENRQFPQSCLTCARQDDVAVRIVDLKALEGDSHEVSTQTDDDVADPVTMQGKKAVKMSGKNEK
jgi:hypothetical protein